MLENSFIIMGVCLKGLNQVVCMGSCLSACFAHYDFVAVAHSGQSALQNIIILCIDEISGILKKEGGFGGYPTRWEQIMTNIQHIDL